MARDANSITQLAESSHGDAGPSPSPSGLLGELASRPGRSVDAWLAFVDDVPAGLAAVVMVGEGSTARRSIAWLLVARPVRRRGVCSALVASIVWDALDRGATQLWAETRADWTAAITFWQAVGFREVP